MPQWHPFDKTPRGQGGTCVSDVPPNFFARRRSTQGRHPRRGDRGDLTTSAKASGPQAGTPTPHTPHTIHGTPCNTDCRHGVGSTHGPTYFLSLSFSCRNIRNASANTCSLSMMFNLTLITSMSTQSLVSFARVSPMNFWWLSICSFM